MHKLRHYTKACAAKTLEKAFPGLKAGAVQRLGAGYHSEAFLVNHAFVFKLPKSRHAGLALEREAQVLRHLAGQLPLKIPDVSFYFQGDAAFPYPIIGYRYIDGRILTPQTYRSFSKEEKEKAAQTIADFLKNLHQLPTPSGIEGLQEDFLQKLEGDYESLRALTFHQIPARARAAVCTYYEAALRSSDLQQGKQALIHYDLSCNHIVLDKRQNTIIGVIDFGDAAVADTDWDFMYLMEESREELGREFGLKVLQYYRHEDPCRLMRKLKLRQAGELFEQILFGDAAQVKPLFRKGMRALKKL